MTIAIYACQARENVVGGVGDQRSEMIAADGAFVLQEIQQIGHLLKIGRHVRIVSPQMDVVI